MEKNDKAQMTDHMTLVLRGPDGTVKATRDSEDKHDETQK